MWLRRVRNWVNPAISCKFALTRIDYLVGCHDSWPMNRHLPFDALLWSIAVQLWDTKSLSNGMRGRLDPLEFLWLRCWGMRHGGNWEQFHWIVNSRTSAAHFFCLVSSFSAFFPSEEWIAKTDEKNALNNSIFFCDAKIQLLCTIFMSG